MKQGKPLVALRVLNFGLCLSLEALHLINSFQKVTSKQGQGAAGGRQNGLISELFKTWQLGQPLIMKLPPLHSQIVTERNNAYLQTCPAALIRALCSALRDARRRLDRKNNIILPFSVILIWIGKKTRHKLVQVCCRLAPVARCGVWTVLKEHLKGRTWAICL